MDLATIIIILITLLNFVIFLHEFKYINDGIFKYCLFVLTLGIISLNILNILGIFK